jgi:2-phospho-L-lactate guanylyltransferase (CobY/MobA/RfbA family)
VNRHLGVLAPASAGPLELAMYEDVVDLVAEMAMVTACAVVPEGSDPAVAGAVWPGMPVVAVPDRRLDSIAAALAAIGADEVGVVVPDAPDLPALLLGKLHSALTSAEVAVCPAADGRLVAVAARLPVATWAGDVTLDGADALDRLRTAAPRRALHVGAGWHRVSDEADARATLDPGLEGWEHTRALLDRG